MAAVVAWLSRAVLVAVFVRPASTISDSIMAASATFDHSSMVSFSPITAVTTIMAAIGMVIRGYVMTRIEPTAPVADGMKQIIFRATLFSRQSMALQV